MTATCPKTPDHRERLTMADIRELAGDINEIDAAKIIATGATRAEFAEAYQYACGCGDVVGRSGHPLVGVVAEIYEMLVADDEAQERRK